MTTILITDDSPIIQRTLSFVLQRAAYTVLQAQDAREAAGFLAAQPVDLLILDLALPEMDGLSWLRQLRADPRYQALPVIMLTASGDDQHSRQARDIGVANFLNKPISSRELLEAVRAALAAPTGG